MRKKTFICMIILTIICIPLLTNKLPEVTGAFSLTDAEVVGMEAVYSALDTVVYWDVEFTWYPYLTMKGCNWRIVGLDSTWRTYDYYLTDDTYNINCTRSARGGDVEIYRFYWNLTNFSPGDYTFESAPEGTASEASDTFGISSDPPSYYPQIDITAPEVFETFDSSLVTSITTSATLEDNGFLTDAEIFWDTTEVWNYTSFTPGENDKTYDIAITEGVTTNDTHDITWTVTDNDGYEWNKTRHVIVYDGILMILMQKPDNYWQQDNNFDFQANFSESNGIDDARMYIYGCTFIGDDKVIVINNVESFLSYLQNYTISDDFYVHSYSLTYSDVQKWLIDYGYDDTGNKYGNRYGDWYVDDAGTFFASLINDLFIDDNGNIYSLMNDYYVDDNGNVYDSENNLMIDDNGNVYTAGDDYLTDDSGEKWYEHASTSEHVVDSGDYYNTVLNYEEDDMSQQYGVWTIDGTDFTRRNNFTITNPKAEAMQDIVIRVPITYDSDMQADMDDITITTDADVLYDYEQNDVVASTSCTIWIRFPTFASSTTYNLIMYYGHATSSSKADSGDTWTNYLQVYHFESSGYSSSTDNYGDLTNSGCDFVSGIVGNGLDIDGSTDYMYRTDTLSGGGYDVRSWLWWANIDTSGHIYHTVWGEHVGGDERVDISNLYNTGWAGWQIDTSGGGSDNYQADGLYNINTWYGHALTLDNNAVEYYLNGVSKSTDTNGIVDGGSANDLFVGKQSDGLAACWFDGELDELMVYNGRLTTNEIYVMYWSIAGNRASWTGEESLEEDWTVGENGAWYDPGNVDGVRDEDYMNMWATSTGGYRYVYRQDEALLLDEPIQNSAYSWEINITVNDINKMDSMGFSMLADTGYYYKMLLTRDGYIVAGVSTSTYQYKNMITGYTHTDISWTGDWITLNITILPDVKIIYFVDDVIVRESYLDDAYQDITDANCGLFYLLVDSYAGEYGNMSIDYFNTTDYGDGHQGSGGQTYAEYSDPSVVVYNGSRYLTVPGTSDAGAIWTGYGDGGWLNYYDEHSVSYKSKFRIADEDLDSYAWVSFDVCTQILTVPIWNDTYYRLKFDVDQDRVYFDIGGHLYGEWDGIETAGYLDGITWDDSWHTYEIQIKNNSWVAGFFDDVLVANTTSQMWLNAWNITDGERGAVGFGIYNVVGYNSSVMEIDYWSEFNYTYNWFTSNKGWDWSIAYGGLGEREDGSMIIWDTLAGSAVGAQGVDGNFYAYTSGYQSAVTYFWEVALTVNETESKYNYICMTSRFGSYYFQIALFGNDTLAVGVTNGSPEGIWYALQTRPLDFVTDQTYYFRIIVISSAIAYQYSLDGITYNTVRYSTADFSSYHGWANNVNLVVDSVSGQSNAFMFIDYFQSGYTSNPWQTDDGWRWNPYSTIGGNRTTDGYMNFYSTDTHRSYLYHSDTSQMGCYHLNQWTQEVRVMFNESESKYEFFAIGSQVGTSNSYVMLAFYPNDTVIFSGWQNTWDISEGGNTEFQAQYSYTWVQGQWYNMTIVFDATNKWAAGVIDGQLVANETGIDSGYFDNTDFQYGMLLVHNTGGNTEASATIDSYETGWRNDWWWVSSEGWGWDIGGVSGDRTDGSMIIYDTVAGQWGYVWINNPYVNDEFYGTDQDQYYIEAMVKPNMTETVYEFFEITLRINTVEYYTMSLYANDTLAFGTGDYWSQASSSWDWVTHNSQTYDFDTDDWYKMAIVIDKTNNWVAFILNDQMIENSTYTIDYQLNDYLILVENNAGQSNGFLFIDYVQSGWRNDWWWVSSEGWGWSTINGQYMDNSRNSGLIYYESTSTSWNSLRTKDDQYADTQGYTNFIVNIKLAYLNTSSRYDEISIGVLVNYPSDPTRYGIIQFNNSGYLRCGIADNIATGRTWYDYEDVSYAWSEDTYVIFRIHFDVVNNWVCFSANEAILCNISSSEIVSLSSNFLTYILQDLSTANSFVAIDYIESGWSDDWWWTSSSGWGWDTYSTGTTVGYQNGTRDGTNGEFYFWSEIDDGDTKITAHQADGLNWSGSYWTTEIRFQICNTTSHYDYVGGSAWVGGDTYVKAFWEYGTSGFRYGMYNNTNGAGDISNSIVSSLDTTYYGTMDNDWHTLRFQMKQTSWLGIYLDEKLIYNYTAVGNTKYLTGTLANVSFSLDSDASQNTRMVKIDYLKTGWTYGEYWGQTQNNTFWQIMDDDWFHSDGYRDDTNGVFDFWSKQDGDYANIYLDESYTNATGDAYYIGVNWTITNATGLYDYVSLATAVGGGNYFQMSWYGSTLEYGIDNTYLNGVFTDSLTTTLSWTPGTYHTWEYYIDLTGNIVTVWLDDVMLVNTTGWSAYLTGTAEAGLILGVDNDAGDTDAHVRVDSVFSGYKGWWSATYSEVGLTNYMDNTLPAAWGEDIMVVHNSTQQCRFDATLTLKVNSTYYSIFENATGTTRTSTWQITDYVWSTYFSEGAFGVSVYLSSDILSVYWHNFTMYYDITPPTLGVRLKPTEPTGVYYADYPPGLDIYSLEWGLNDGQDNLVEVDLNNGDRVYDWIVTQEKPENFPTQVEYITRIEGDHILLVRAIDNAGNEANETITFTIVRRKPITFSFKANSGDAIPQYIAEQYRIEINSFATDGLTGYTIYDTFALGIYDPFDQTLYYSASVSYTANIEVTLSSVYKVIFSNAEDVPVELTIQKTSGQQSFICAGLSDVTWYLDDETYKIIADPMGAKRTIHTQFIATDFNLAVTASGTNVLTLQLDFIEVDGMQGLSFSSITDMLNLATWGILLVVIISTVIILRRLRPPIMRIQDEIVPQIPLFPIKITDKKQWTPKDKKTSFSSGKPKKQKPKDGKWQDIFA